MRQIMPTGHVAHAQLGCAREFCRAVAKVIWSVRMPMLLHEFEVYMHDLLFDAEFRPVLLAYLT